MDMYQKRKMRKEKREQNEEQNQNGTRTCISWYPGHMAKTKRQIAEKLNLIDVVYEVIDARMPISSKIVDINNLIKDKPKILIMTKYDICDKEETNKFVKYYQEQGYIVIPVDLMSGLNVKKITEETKKLMVDMNQKRKEKGMKERNIRALIVGVPNAGKSTLINRLVGKKSVTVGDRPGVTKNLSWIRIAKDIDLMDSPGILWPKIENQENAHILAIMSSIKEEILNIDALAKFTLEKVMKLYPDSLKERYGIEEIDDDLTEVYEQIAKKRGALSRGGIPDYEKVSHIIVRDLKNGYLGNLTLDRFENE